MPVVGVKRAPRPTTFGSRRRSSAASSSSIAMALRRAFSARAFIRESSSASVATHELAARLVGDPVFVAESLGGLGATPAEVGLEAAGLVVDAGVDDAAVVPGLVAGEARLLLDQEHGGTRPDAAELERRRQPHDPAADDAEIVDHGAASVAVAASAARGSTRATRPSRNSTSAFEVAASAAPGERCASLAMRPRRAITYLRTASPIPGCCS